MSAEGEGGADDERKGADFLSDFLRFFHRVGNARTRHIETDPDHCLFEKLAIFAHVDGCGLGSDHFDAVLVERAGLEERHGGIQRGLTAERRQQGVRLLADDDFFHHFRCNRLDVSAMREFRIRHDRRRIRVYEDDFVAFFFECLARLDA